MTRNPLVPVLHWTAAFMFPPTGAHRADPERPAGAVVDQQFVQCGRCSGIESAATVHGDQLRCAEGHLQPVGGGA